MSITIYNYSVTGDCSNTSAGAVYFDITGTTPPFAVTCIDVPCILPTSASTYSYSATSLSANTYFLEVVDGGLNKSLISVYISSGTNATIDSTSTTCGFDNGTITGFTSGVYGKSTFYLYDGSSNLYSSGETPNNYFDFGSLSAGTYYIVADDGGGCSGITPSVIITSSTTFTYGAYIVDDGSCLGGPSGKIFITGLTYPVSAYTIDWLTDVNGQTGTTITGLTEGPYTVEITDPIGCLTTKSFSVGAVGDLTSGGFIVISQPTCFSSDGSVEFIITGGTPPYFFSASTGQVDITFSQSSVFTNLAASNYSFMVTDAGLCTIFDSVSLVTPSSFNTVQVITTPSTCSVNDGTVQVIVDGGFLIEPNLTITLSGASGTQFIGTVGDANQIFYGLSNDNYLVSVETPGCTYTAITTVSSTNLYTFTATTTGTTCGSANGIVEIVASTGATFPVIYTLEGPLSNPVTYVSPIGRFTNLEGGNYTLTVQDSSPTNCIQNEPVFIDNSESVYFNLLTVEPFSSDDGSIRVYVMSGEPPYTYLWDGGVASGQTGTTVTGLTSGEYSLTVTDSSGCTLTKSVTLKGTKKVNSYRYFNICQHQFHNSSTMGYRNIRNMYLEGFTDLTSGNTNCIVNESIFSIYAEVGNQSVQIPFYTGTSINDFPSDVLWSQTLIDTLDSFVGISGTTVDISNNRVIIRTTCEEIPKDCATEIFNPLQDTVVTVNLIIDYDLSCEYCPPTPTPTPTPTNTPSITPTNTVTPSFTPTNTVTPSFTPTNTITPSITKSPTPTPSYTPGFVGYQWTGGATWFGDSGTACSNYISFGGGDWSLANTTPIVTDFLINNSTGLPITGQAGNWIAISSTSAPGVVIYAVQVDAFGEIIDVITCP